MCVCVCVSAAEQVDDAAEEYLRTYNELNRLVSLSRGFFKDPDEQAELDKLQRSLEGKDDDDDDDDDDNDDGGDDDDGPAQMVYYKTDLLPA